MIYTCSSNRNPLSHISPQAQIIRSSSDLKRLSLRKSHPASLEFRLEDDDTMTKASFKKLMTFLSKKTLKLSNPPAKEVSKSGRHTRHLKSLQIKPQDASKYISKITRRFSKLTHFAIHDEQDVFKPIRIQQKVYPMRNLRSFVYDHEFCRDFMICARYVRELKIRKASLSLVYLKRLERLEKLHLLLRTKYLSLPVEDIQMTKDLGDILLRKPSFKKLTLEQEVDTEVQSYIFMELNNILKDKATVSLIVDFVDLSSPRNRDMSVEKIMQKIQSLGIENLDIKYAGVSKVMKVYDRLFNAPVHMREDVYTRFLRTIMDTSFKNINFLPSVHSSHIDYDLRDTLIKFLKPSPNLKIPGLNITYHIETIDPFSLGMLEDVYEQKVPAYEINIVNTAHNIRKCLAEELDKHYSRVFSKVDQARTEFSLQIVGKNLEVLGSILRMIVPKINLSLLKNLNVELIDPVDNKSLQSVFGLLVKSGIMGTRKHIGIDISQKEAPNPDDLFSFLISFSQAFRDLSKVNLIYRNTGDYGNTLRRIFEELRLRNRWVEFNYETYHERNYYE